MAEGNPEWLPKIPISIMQLGTDLKVMFANDEAKRLLSFLQHPPYRGAIPDMLYGQLESAMHRGEIVGGSSHHILIKSPEGTYVHFFAQRLGDTIIPTLEDVTGFEWAKSEERAMREEIDRAFTFSLLEPSVAKKLACTPEYRG